MEQYHILLIIATIAIGIATFFLFKLYFLVAKKEKDLNSIKDRLKAHRDSSKGVYNEKLALKAKVSRLERELKELKPKKTRKAKSLKK